MELDMEILFPGEKRVDVRLRDHVIHTDQPAQFGGQDAYPAPFDQKFHLLLNVAVGGAAPNPDNGTVLPQEMQVDWIRVYNLGSGGGGTCEPAGTPCDGSTNCCNGCSGGKPGTKVCL